MDMNLDRFLALLEEESKDRPNLIPFFRSIFVYYFVFASINTSKVTDRRLFLKNIFETSSSPYLEFVFKSFRFDKFTDVKEYLQGTKWWWEYIVIIKNEGLSIYHLSKLYESTSGPKKRKTTGSFFTPKELVRFICRYSLSQYLIIDDTLEVDSSTIHRIIFNSDISEDDQVICRKILDIISSMSIIDPSVGIGLFFHEIIEVFTPILSKVRSSNSKSDFQTMFESLLQNLIGYDIDSDKIILTKFLLLHHWIAQITPSQFLSIEAIEKFLKSLINIKNEDFLLEENSVNLKFDLCVGNPPYVRHHEIDKKKIIEKLITTPEYQSVFSGAKRSIDSKADLYVYFWIKLILNLNLNGIFGLVLSRSWYSSRFIEPINALLFEKYLNIDLVLELPLESWKSAEIITNIIVGHKVTDFNRLHSSNVIVWKGKLAKLLENTSPLTNYLSIENNIRSAINSESVVESWENEEIRISQVTNPHLLFSSNRSEQFPVIRLDYLTMAPFLLHQVLMANKGKFCFLKQLGRLSLGSTTGANKFFYLTEEAVQSAGLSFDHLVPMTKSPKDYMNLTKASPKKPLYLLHIPVDYDIGEDEKLRQLLERNKDEIFSRPYFRNKNESNWYRIKKIQPDILIPNMTFLRSFVAFNPQKLHIDKQWIGFWSENSLWDNFLLGFFNSSLGMLLREIQGTRTLGLGSLKLSLNECKNLLILDPKKIPDTILKQINELIVQMMELTIPRLGEKTKYSEIQTELDRLICVEYLQLPPPILEEIQHALKFEVEWRLGRSL